MLAFPREFFELQLKFAKQISEHYKISFKDAIFLYTSIYTRLIGFHDEKPPKKTNPKWIKIMNNLPKSLRVQIDYIYDKYVDYEKNKSIETNQIKFGCFSYSYHSDENKFELHFSNADPKGNLGRDRVKFRLKELKQHFQSMKAQNKKNAKVYLITWLLNIEAFRRLYPPKFIELAKPLHKQLAQDSAHWGQFVDRKGNLKQDLADKLLSNSKKFEAKVNNYFPLPNLTSEVEQQVFYDFYF